MTFTPFTPAVAEALLKLCELMDGIGPRVRLAVLGDDGRQPLVVLHLRPKDLLCAQLVPGGSVPKAVDALFRMGFGTVQLARLFACAESDIVQMIEPGIERTGTDA